MAFFLLLIVLVMAIGTLHRTLKHNKTQEHTTRCSLLAHQKMEEAMLVMPRLLKAASGSFEAPFTDYSFRRVIQPHPEQDDFIIVSVTVSGPANSHFKLSAHRRGSANILWFASNNNAAKKSRLYQVFEDGLELEQIHTWGEGRFNDLQPTLSGDGLHVAFVSDRNKKRQVFTMPTDSSEAPQQRTENATGAFEPAWCPTDSKIVYTSYEDGFSQIWRLDLETGHTENLSPTKQHESNPVWGPKGEKIAFVSTNRKSGGSRIGIMTADGKTRKYIAEEKGWNTAPSFSPDGTKIAYMSNKDGDPEIYMFTVNGSHTRQITNNEFYDTAPEFSPDGKKIAFWSKRNSVAQLFVQKLNEKEAKLVINRSQVPPVGAFEKDPCWLPSPKN